MLGEFMRRFVNQVSRYAYPARDRVRRVSVQRRAVAARERVHRRRFAHAFRRYHLRHAEREQPFGAGLYWNPLVGVRRRHRKARIDVVMRPALAVDALPKLAVSARVANGRPPSVQEIRAERQDEVGAGEVEVRHPVLPEHGLDGAFQVGFLQRLKRGVSRAVSVHEAADDVSEMPAHRVGGYDDAALSAFGAGVLQVERQPADGVRPADFFELVGAALARADHRTANPVRVVERLQPGFASGAVLADVDRVVDVALYLLGAPFHDADDDAFAGGALAAQRGVPVVAPGHQILRHLDGGLDEQLVFRHAASRENHGGGGGAARERHKLSSGQSHVGVAPLSSGRLCSRSGRRFRGGTQRSRPS